MPPVDRPIRISRASNVINLPMPTTHLTNPEGNSHFELIPATMPPSCTLTAINPVQLLQLGPRYCKKLGPPWYPQGGDTLLALSGHTKDLLDAYDQSEFNSQHTIFRSLGESTAKHSDFSCNAYEDPPPPTTSLTYDAAHKHPPRPKPTSYLEALG
jgi:hypothetical protein